MTKPVVLFDGALTITSSEHPILVYAATLDEEMSEHRLKQMAGQIGWRGDMLVIANTAENELARAGANDDLQVARDWLNGKDVFVDDTKQAKTILDLSRERLAADLPIGGRVHVHGKSGGYFYEKLSDGTLKETFVPRRPSAPKQSWWQRMKSRLSRRFG